MFKFLAGFLLALVLVFFFHTGAWSRIMVEDAVPEIQQVFRRAIDAIKPKPSRPEMEWRISL